MTDLSSVPLSNERTTTPPINTPQEVGQVSHGSSPVKAATTVFDQTKQDQWARTVYKGYHSEISPEDMITKLCPPAEDKNFWDNFSNLLKDDGNVPDLNTKKALPVDRADADKLKDNTKNPESPRQPEDKIAIPIIEFLNEISDFISIKSPSTQSYTLRFMRRGSKAPLDHPVKTECRPDVVVYRKYRHSKFTTEKLSWSHLEGTAEVKSSKKSIEISQGQAAAYTAYHLQARPDRVSVTGAWFDHDKFSIIHTDACRIYHTKPIPYATPDKKGKQKADPPRSKRLLCAYVWSLYHPNLDPTLFNSMNKLVPDFTWRRQNGELLRGLGIKFAVKALGRRTTILFNSNAEIVLKEQYIYPDRRFLEWDLLNKIHGSGVFPGVVRLEEQENGLVKRGTENISVEHEGMIRCKSRICMKDKGTPLLKVKKLLIVLKVLYDLLEVILKLHECRGILHRDISAGNIIVRGEDDNPNEHIQYDDDSTRYAQDLGDMCFIDCMLKGLDDKSEDAEPDTSGAFPATDNERFRSPLLLADFDSGEDVKDNGEKEPLPRTGTPVFTARMVRNKTCYPAGDDQRSPGPPGVHKRIRRCYKKWHPARVEAYVDVQKEFVTVPDDTKVPGYQHRPGYDAESVFWFLVYWGMLAKPTDGEEKKINRAHWTSLTDPTDDRDRFVRGFPNDFFHPFYEPLKPLIRGMAAHLVVDSDLVTDKRKQEPYYLIEVFKRLILDFIIDNLTESFMVDPKSEKDREVEPDATGVKTSTNIEGTTTYESTNLGADGPENSSNESESNDVESQDEIESGFDSGFTSEAEYFGIKGSERHKYYPMSDGRKQREEKDGMQGVSIGMTASSSSSNVSGKKRKRTSTSAVHSSASSQDKWPGALRRRSSDHLPGTSPSDDEDQSGDYVDKGSFKRRHRRK